MSYELVVGRQKWAIGCSQSKNKAVWAIYGSDNSSEVCLLTFKLGMGQGPFPVHAKEWCAGFTPAGQWLTTAASFLDLATAHSVEESFSCREYWSCIRHLRSTGCNSYGLFCHVLTLVSYLVLHNCSFFSSSLIFFCTCFVISHVDKSRLQ